MNKLKICFIGIGSIAKRHIKNLISICQEKEISIQIDALRRKNSVNYNIEGFQFNTIFYEYDEIPSDYDVIFITNPTEYHIEALERVHNKARHFFIEKPITSYQKISMVSNLIYRSESVYYVACPLRYTNIIQYIKNTVNLNDVLSVRCISSSYLPDWRPGTNYKDSYSAHKELGGGVSIDLIHEWDYIQYLFGNPSNILCLSGKISNLDINSEDYACYIADYRDKIVELHLDYFGREPIRQIMLIMKDETLVGDFVKCKIYKMKSGDMIDFSETRDDYQKKELEYFLSLIKDEQAINYIPESCRTLNYTQGVV